MTGSRKKLSRPRGNLFQQQQQDDGNNRATKRVSRLGKGRQFSGSSKTREKEKKKVRKKSCETKIVARGGFLDLGSAYRPGDWMPTIPSRDVLTCLGSITWKARYP